MKSFIVIFRLLLGALCLIAVLYAGFQLGNRFNKGFLGESRKVTHTEVLLEQIKNSLKLVTVEGTFSEIYDYKSYKLADWSPFKKQALIRVKANVQIGYDLEQMSIDVDERRKVLTLSYDPTPRLISVEHDMDYYDIREGTFNHFSVEEYNFLGDRAKDFVVSQAMKSSLPGHAEERLNQLIEELDALLIPLGYTLEIEETPIVSEVLPPLG